MPHAQTAASPMHLGAAWTMRRRKAPASTDDAFTCPCDPTGRRIHGIVTIRRDHFIDLTVRRGVYGVLAGGATAVLLARKSIFPSCHCQHIAAGVPWQMQHLSKRTWRPSAAVLRSAASMCRGAIGAGSSSGIRRRHRHRISLLRLAASGTLLIDAAT